MSCFKVCYNDLSVDEIVTMVNDDDLPDTVLCRKCRIGAHVHKRVDRLRACFWEKTQQAVDCARRLVGKKALPHHRPSQSQGVPASELFTPQMLVAGADERQSLALTRVPTGMSTISVSSIQSLTPSRLAASAAASGSSESDVLNDYLDAVWLTQPPRLTDVDHPLFSVNMVTYIQRMQEGRF